MQIAPRFACTSTREQLPQSPGGTAGAALYGCQCKQATASAGRAPFGYSTEITSDQ